MKTYTAINWRNLAVFIIIAVFMTMLGLYTGMISALLDSGMGVSIGFAILFAFFLGRLFILN